MILFSILAVTLAVLTLFVIVTVGIGGGLFVILFGDVIVCIVFIVLMIKGILGRH